MKHAVYYVLEDNEQKLIRNYSFKNSLHDMFSPVHAATQKFSSTVYDTGRNVQPLIATLWR
jgi:hypothetical protein